MDSIVSDHELIARIHGGDSAVFTELYDRYIKKIYNFIYFKTSHKETAEDLTSQTFMKAWRMIETFQVEKGTFKAWLYQIARNSVIDYYRTQKATSDINEVPNVSDGNSIEENLTAKVGLDKVEEYLQDLKPDQREIVIMRVWQELSYQEIAEITGRSEASLKMMFMRTIKTLRVDLAEVLVILLVMVSIFNF